MPKKYTFGSHNLNYCLTMNKQRNFLANIVDKYAMTVLGNFTFVCLDKQISDTFCYIQHQNG